MSRYHVAIIGGGIAGTSAGYFLARAGKAVVVLEREETLGFHSTGRSASVFTECYGTPLVRRLAIASRPFLESPPPGFADTPLLGDRSILFAATNDQADRLPAEAAEQQELVPTVRLLTSDEAIAQCPVLDPAVIAGGILEPGARDLDVHALHLGYQRGLRAHGGEIRVGFGVDRIERDGASWRIGGESGEVIADVIVDAAGAWCDVVARMAGAEPVNLVAKGRTVFTFAPHGLDPRRWPMVIDLDERWYFKPEGTQLLGSPADATPVAPHDIRHREEDVALGIERIEAVTTLSIRTIESAWAGLRSFVTDGNPVNGWDDKARGFYWLAGQGGFGIKSSPAMGRYAAAMISDWAPPEDLAASGLDDSALGVGRLRR